MLWTDNLLLLLVLFNKKKSKQKFLDRTLTLNWWNIIFINLAKLERGEKNASVISNLPKKVSQKRSRDNENQSDTLAATLEQKTLLTGDRDDIELRSASCSTLNFLFVCCTTERCQKQGRRRSHLFLYLVLYLHRRPPAPPSPAEWLQAQQHLGPCKHLR